MGSGDTATPTVELYAVPHDHDWNGLPVHGAPGIELGLIKKFKLPWNMRSAGRDLHLRKHQLDHR